MKNNTTKRTHKPKFAMKQLSKNRKPYRKTSGFVLSLATNETLYTLVNLEAMMSGKSTSSFLESILMERYGDRIANFDLAFANLRKIEGR